jgi:hypothetical protein
MVSRFDSDSLGWFELPRAWAEPAVRFLRLANTTLDFAFYDVNRLVNELRSLGVSVVTEEETTARTDFGGALTSLNLDALSNPEGAILIVSAQGPPFVTPFDDVTKFLQHAKEHSVAIESVSITGVGSSALGSAAFAWNLSTALGEPVAAIVPGYGVADVVEQALGGWFGFGMYNFWVKQLTQEVLARTAPAAALIGRRLMKSAPGHVEAGNGVPLFRRGNGSSDVLHSLLSALPGIRRLFGHSKGALVIHNAVEGLPVETTSRLQIVTFGCPIDESAPPVAGFHQVLGRLDGLGWLNAWGNPPDLQITSLHTTNSFIPLSMPIARLTEYFEGAGRARGGAQEFD